MPEETFLPLKLISLNRTSSNNSIDMSLDSSAEFVAGLPRLIVVLHPYCLHFPSSGQKDLEEDKAASRGSNRVLNLPILNGT